MTVTKLLIAKVNPFYPVVCFYIPESIRKPTGFLFSRGIEKEHCLKLGNNHWDATVINKTKSKLLYQCDFCLSLIFYVLVLVFSMLSVTTEVLKPPGMYALSFFVCFFFVVVALVIVTCFLQKLWLLPSSASYFVLLEDLVSLSPPTVKLNVLNNYFPWAPSLN